MGTLTVRENLTFSAALRLPSYLSFKQRKEKVDSVIEELGLTDCQHTKVSTVVLCGHREGWRGPGSGWADRVEGKKGRVGGMKKEQIELKYVFIYVCAMCVYFCIILQWCMHDCIILLYMQL